MNLRGRFLSEAFTDLDEVLANIGTSVTFRGRFLGSIVDLIYVSVDLASRSHSKSVKTILTAITRQSVRKSRVNRAFADCRVVSLGGRRKLLRGPSFLPLSGPTLQEASGESRNRRSRGGTQTTEWPLGRDYLDE